MNEQTTKDLDDDDTIQPPPTQQRINSELLQELYSMDKPNFQASKMFKYWKATIENNHRGINKEDGSFDPLNIQYFEKFTNLTVTLSGSLNEGVDIPEACFVPGENKEFLMSASGEEIDCTVHINEIKVSEKRRREDGREEEGTRENYGRETDRRDNDGRGEEETREQEERKKDQKEKGRRWRDGGIQMEFVDAYPGFVHLRVDGSQAIEMWAPLSNITCDESGRIRGVYISPVAFTDEWYMLLLCKNSMLNIRYQFADVNNEKDTREILILTNQEGPAIKTTIFAGVERFQIDTAISMKCDRWPSAANEWLDRIRPSSWPSPSLIKECEESLGACVVPKYPHDSTTQLEWRISFVDVEGALMRSLSKTQRACYRIFKGIWRIGLRAPANR